MRVRLKIVFGGKISTGVYEKCGKSDIISIDSKTSNWKSVSISSQELRKNVCFNLYNKKRGHRPIFSKKKKKKIENVTIFWLQNTILRILRMRVAGFVKSNHVRTRTRGPHLNPLRLLICFKNYKH